MTLDYLARPADHILAARAAAHVVLPTMLAPEARWSGWGVNDTEVARVMLALERGTPIKRVANGRWYVPSGSPLNGRSVSTVVNEMIRTGLLINVPWSALVPARVHLVDQVGVDYRTACGDPGEGCGPKRVRIVSEPVMVDCLACLDRL